jgi:uncharacterized glyoxalase superfamily protein PhnB
VPKYSPSRSKPSKTLLKGKQQSMAEYPKISLAFNIGPNNIDRIEAFELYQKAFNAKKIFESTPPDGDDLHIRMEINGFSILLAPGGEQSKENNVILELGYDNEQDLRQAYAVLIQEGRNYSIGSYPWAPVGAFVTDKYGISWWLHT